MHAAVRAAGAVEGDPLARDLKEGALQLRLHGDAVGLRLPADIFRSVVLNDEANALHSHICITGTAARNAAITSAAHTSRREKRSSRMRVLPSPPW